MPKRKCAKPAKKNATVFKPLKEGVLYVCVRKGGIRSSVELKDFQVESHWNFTIQENDILMSLGEVQTRRLWNTAIFEMQRFFHLPSMTNRWVLWEKNAFHQLKGISDKKFLRGMPKVV